MTKTTASEGGVLAIVIATLFLGCATNPGTSGETHFVCKTTEDCVEHATDLVCIERICRHSTDGSVGQSGNGGTGAGGTSASGGSITASGGTLTGGQPDASTGGVSDAGAGGAAQSEAGPPAQAALTIRVSPTLGKQCPASGSYLSFPFIDATGVFDQLQCDPSAGCMPDRFVVVDGQDSATVSCAVIPKGTSYLLSVSLNVDDRANVSASFQASGVVSPTGGMISLTETNSAYGGGGTDQACTLTILPSSGFIASGKVWAQFNCPTFRDQMDIADTQCLAEGIFLFENCATH